MLNEFKTITMQRNFLLAPFLSINKNTSPVLALLNFNSVWRAQVVKYILIRYKIFFLFIFLMLAPTFSSLKFIVTLPTRNIMGVHVKYNVCFLALLTYQGLGLIWISLQQAVFSNQAWEKYILSLPLTKKQIYLTRINFFKIIKWGLHGNYS